MHFAVINQNVPLCRLLVDNGASVHAHASGDFLYSNIHLYFGGSPLGFAACVSWSRTGWTAHLADARLRFPGRTPS